MRRTLRRGCISGWDAVGRGAGGEEGVGGADRVAIQEYREWEEGGSVEGPIAPEADKTMGLKKVLFSASFVIF